MSIASHCLCNALSDLFVPCHVFSKPPPGMHEPRPVPAPCTCAATCRRPAQGHAHTWRVMLASLVHSYLFWLSPGRAIPELFHPQLVRF